MRRHKSRIRSSLGLDFLFIEPGFNFSLPIERVTKRAVLKISLQFSVQPSLLHVNWMVVGSGGEMWGFDSNVHNMLDVDMLQQQNDFWESGWGIIVRQSIHNHSIFSSIQTHVHTHPPPTPVAISASLCGLCSSKGKNSPYCSCLYAAAFHSLDDEHELPTFNWSVPRYCFSRPIVGPSILTPEPLKGILSGNWKGSFSTDLNKSGYPHTHTFELLITNGVRLRIRKWVSHSGLIDDDLRGASPSRKLNPIREPSGPSFYLPQGYLPTKFTKITLNELCVNELRHHEDIELRMRRGLHCFPSIVE